MPFQFFSVGRASSATTEAVRKLRATVRDAA
jgi:hypothetical protein